MPASSSTTRIRDASAMVPRSAPITEHGLFASSFSPLADYEAPLTDFGIGGLRPPRFQPIGDRHTVQTHPGPRVVQRDLQRTLPGSPLLPDLRAAAQGEDRGAHGA